MPAKPRTIEELTAQILADNHARSLLRLLYVERDWPQRPRDETPPPVS